MSSSPLSQQIILITGASTGIGGALAETLAARFSGIRLVLAARNQEKLAEVAYHCRQSGAEILTVTTDMADTAQVQALAKEAISHFGRVDVLVNNAGYGQMGPIELIPPEAAKEQFAVNFHGPLTLTQALIPAMREQGGGKIINISSLGGRMAFPVAGVYSCSKFALEALTDVLRMELKAFNIKAISIEPGPVITNFFQVAWEKVQKYLPAAETSIYRPIFNNIESFDKQVNLLGWSSQKVAQVIIKAMLATNPRPRYIAATGGSIFVFFMTKMPTWITDSFWKRFYGIDLVEREWKIAKEQESKK